MPINFVPERGRSLLCAFRCARVHPEMDKVRRVVVLSPRSDNARHGRGAGRCLVIPFSATDPGQLLTPADVAFQAGVYRCLTVDTWTICSAVMSASHDRLDKVRAGQDDSRECPSDADMQRIELGLKHASGLA